MEANENNEPKKESSPSEQNIPKEKTQQSSDNKNMSASLKKIISLFYLIY